MLSMSAARLLSLDDKAKQEHNWTGYAFAIKMLPMWTTRSLRAEMTKLKNSMLPMYAMRLLSAEVTKPGHSLSAHHATGG